MSPVPQRLVDINRCFERRRRNVFPVSRVRGYVRVQAGDCICDEASLRGLAVGAWRGSVVRCYPDFRFLAGRAVDKHVRTNCRRAIGLGGTVVMGTLAVRENDYLVAVSSDLSDGDLGKPVLLCGLGGTTRVDV